MFRESNSHVKPFPFQIQAGLMRSPVPERNWIGSKEVTLDHFGTLDAPPFPNREDDGPEDCQCKQGCHESTCQREVWRIWFFGCKWCWCGQRLHVRHRLPVPITVGFRRSPGGVRRSLRGRSRGWLWQWSPLRALRLLLLLVVEAEPP